MGTNRTESTFQRALANLDTVDTNSTVGAIHETYGTVGTNNAGTNPWALLRAVGTPQHCGHYPWALTATVGTNNTVGYPWALISLWALTAQWAYPWALKHCGLTAVGTIMGTNAAPWALTTQWALIMGTQGCGH
jgi:hypothetical protein